MTECLNEGKILPSPVHPHPHPLGFKREDTGSISEGVWVVGTQCAVHTVCSDRPQTMPKVVSILWPTQQQTMHNQRPTTSL